jgi:hypothetical protein
MDIYPYSPHIVAESLVDTIGKEYDAFYLGSGYHRHVHFHIQWSIEDMYNH